LLSNRVDRNPFEILMPRNYASIQVFRRETKQSNDLRGRDHHVGDWLTWWPSGDQSKGAQYARSSWTLQVQSNLPSPLTSFPTVSASSSYRRFILFLLDFLRSYWVLRGFCSTDLRTVFIVNRNHLMLMMMVSVSEQVSRNGFILCAHILRIEKILVFSFKTEIVCLTTVQRE